MLHTEILVEEIEPKEEKTHKNDGNDGNSRCHLNFWTSL